MKHIRSIVPSGDSAVLIRLEQTISSENTIGIYNLMSQIRSAKIIGITDLIPAYCSLMVCYDPALISWQSLHDRLKDLSSLQQDDITVTQRHITIPAVYGGIYGEDLPSVAELCGLSEDEVIAIHSGTDYFVHMIGFLPGFPYLGGLDERIAVRRLDEPRIRIPAGSVGIGGSQTGIYPLDSPGGWRLIAKTPVRIYDPASKDPVLFRPMDIVRFQPVSEAEYLDMEQAVANGEHVHIITEGGTSWGSGS